MPLTTEKITPSAVKITSLIFHVSLCVLLAVGAYLVADLMMGSLMGFRSPLRSSPPQPALPLGEPLTRKLVFVLVDALRIDTADDPQVMPTLASLRDQGASAILHSRTPSFSQPGFATLVTGAWPEINDSMVFNAEYTNIQPYSQDTLFDAALHAGVKTAVAGFNWFEKLLPQAAVSASYYTAGEDAVADRAVVDAALPWLEDPTLRLVFIHLDQVDYAGHQQGGPQNPAWNAAAGRVDGLIAEISARLDFSQDTLLIVSDHGQIDRGGHGGHDPITLLEPLVMVGKGVNPGIYSDASMTAVAPTVSALLGLNLPASAQSAPLVEMLDLPPERIAAIQAAYPLQQAALAEAYSQAISTPLDDRLTAAGEFQAAIETARIDRLQAERLPRIILAWAIILIILFFFPWRKWRSWIWLLSGAALYLLLFNLRYAVIDKSPYSFSALRSQDWVITFWLTSAAIGLVAAALFTGWREGWLATAPLKAMLRLLDLSLVIVFFLALPVLVDYALNGLITRWTLPDLALQFLAVFCLMQIIMIAGLSLLLAGIAAAIVKIVQARSAARQPLPQAGL